jgi:hypothetical protein
VDRAGIITAVGGTRGGITGTAGAWQPNYPGTGLGSGFALRLDPAGNGRRDAHYLTHVGAVEGGSLTQVMQQDDGWFVVVGRSTSPSFPTQPS